MKKSEFEFILNKVLPCAIIAGFMCGLVAQFIWKVDAGGEDFVAVTGEVSGIILAGCFAIQRIAKDC